MKPKQKWIGKKSIKGIVETNKFYTNSACLLLLHRLNTQMNNLFKKKIVYIQMGRAHEFKETIRIGSFKRFV